MIVPEPCPAPRPTGPDGLCATCGRPTLLDAFCCEGGSAVGYTLAGFCVTGVDIAPQPNYPYAFVQGDAVALVRAVGHAYSAHGGSPPCQRYSDLARRNGNGATHPDLVDPYRRAVRATGRPYAIENVEGAPLEATIVLCGTQFPGLRVLRHRLFETSFPVPPPPLEHPVRHPLVFTMDKRKAHYGRLDQDVSFVQVTGGGNATIANKRAAMGGLSWMSGHGVNEAIPPAYAEHIGRAMYTALISHHDHDRRTTMPETPHGDPVTDRLDAVALILELIPEVSAEDAEGALETLGVTQDEMALALRVSAERAQAAAERRAESAYLGGR